MKRILLTGGSGFIGRNIKEQLGNKYIIFSPTSVELNLLDNQAIKRYITCNQITHVIHSAVYNQKYRVLDANNDLKANLMMFYNLVECGDMVEKMIYFGSGAEYDKRYPIVDVKEEMIGVRIPLLNDYALSKYIMNQEARNSNNIYNLRLFGVYGKYENEVTCLVPHLCKCAINKQSLTIRQDCWFDFIYIDDLMTVLEWVIEGKPLFHDYNVCSGNKVKLSMIAQTVKQIAGVSAEVICTNPGYNLAYTANNERLLQEMDWQLTSMARGIEKTYAYYQGK